jgi:hypothetical protein
VGALNIVLAIFGLFLGLILLVLGPELMPILGIIWPTPTTPSPPGAPPRQFVMWTACMAAGLGMAILSVVLLVSALALLLRKPWGRSLTLAIALFSGPVALVSLLNQNILGFEAAAIYNLVVFAVLLAPAGAAEFERHD